MLAFIERRRARALVYGEGRRVIYSHAAKPGPRRACATLLQSTTALQ